MARVKRTTRKPAAPAADRIEGPHGGTKPRQVGAQTGLEKQALSGQSGARANSVKQVGPSSIRPANAPTGSVKRVGTKNHEDVYATQGLQSPDSRQEGSVKQVGPASREYSRLLEGSGSAGSFRGTGISRSRRVIHDTRLLISGVGRRHPRAAFAGSPGSFKGNRAVRVAGGAGGSVRIDGRPRGAFPAGEEETVEPTGPTIVPGS